MLCSSCSLPCAILSLNHYASCVALPVSLSFSSSFSLHRERPSLPSLLKFCIGLLFPLPVFGTGMEVGFLSYIPSHWRLGLPLVPSSAYFHPFPSLSLSFSTSSLCLHTILCPVSLLPLISLLLSQQRAFNKGLLHVLFPHPSCKQLHDMHRHKHSKRHAHFFTFCMRGWRAARAGRRRATPPHWGGPLPSHPGMLVWWW